MMAFIKGFLSGDGANSIRQFPRWAQAYHCNDCDAVQPRTPNDRCAICGRELLSIQKLFTLQRRHIARLIAQIHTLELANPRLAPRPKVVGKVIPWDATAALGRKGVRS